MQAVLYGIRTGAPASREQRQLRVESGASLRIFNGRNVLRASFVEHPGSRDLLRFFRLGRVLLYSRKKLLELLNIDVIHNYLLLLAYLKV